MQIPILNGIYTDERGEFRTVYPRNLIPVPKQQGISSGYLKPALGIVDMGATPGIDRGGINWNGVCYRVAGTKLIRVNADGTYDTLGDVDGSGQCKMDYSFDRLAIESSGVLYYWDGLALTKVTDPDLGIVVDFIWIDGYFLTTNGEYLVVTELVDPTSINPLKYGSSEADPDPIVAVVKLHGEPYAVNRYTIEAFENVGGSFFPYQRIPSALINRGAVGTHAVVIFKEMITFVGSGRKESLAVWSGANAGTMKISSRAIDKILKQYSESVLSEILMETMVDENHEWLFIHLPDQTLVYDANASEAIGEPVWFTLDSGLTVPKAYRARNIVWCYDKWIVGDPVYSHYGSFSDYNSSHYDTKIGWEFGTTIIYNEGYGALIHELELVALPGRVPLGVDPTVWTSYSDDGETYSTERSISAGKQGQRKKRLIWLQQGPVRNWRIQKFRGNSDSHMSIARLEARMEGLNA